jgi:hypothetical protein
MRFPLNPRVTAPTLGVLAGLGGLTHAIGEMRQGAVAPDGLTFESWAEGPIHDYMGGDPAMSLIPHLFLTGLAVIVVAAALLWWSLAPIRSTRRGWGLLGLSVLLLLVGGGFGPPTFGIVGGIAAIVLGRRRAGMRSGDRVLARAWPWVYVALVAAGTVLIIGGTAGVYLLDITNGDIFFGDFAVIVALGALAIPTGAARNRLVQLQPAEASSEAVAAAA